MYNSNYGPRMVEAVDNNNDITNNYTTHKITTLTHMCYNCIDNVILSKINNIYSNASCGRSFFSSYHYYPKP